MSCTEKIHMKSKETVYNPVVHCGPLTVLTEFEEGRDLIKLGLDAWPRKLRNTHVFCDG